MASLPLHKWGMKNFLNLIQTGLCFSCANETIVTGEMYGTIHNSLCGPLGEIGDHVHVQSMWGYSTLMY
jgi:hypothetical protein